MCRQNKWLLLLLCVFVLCVSACGNSETDPGKETETTNAQERTTSSESEMEGEDHHASWDLIGEDEMLVVYEKGDYMPSIMTQVSEGKLIIFGRGGEILYEDERAYYKGSVGIMKKTEPLPIGHSIPDSAGKEGSTILYGIYLVSEGKYVVDPVYQTMNVYGSSAGCWYGDYIYYSNTEGYSGEEQVYVYVSGQSYEGYFAYTDGTHTWVAKSLEEVDFYVDGALQQAYRDVQILTGGEKYVVLIPSDFEESVYPEELTAVYSIDGTELFRLSDWKENHPTNRQLIVNDAYADGSLFVILENGPEQKKTLVNVEGKVLREIADPEYFYLPYLDNTADDTVYYGVNDSDSETWYDENGSQVSIGGHERDLQICEGGWFRYQDNGAFLFVRPSTGEEKRIPYQSVSAWAEIYGNGLVMLVDGTTTVYAPDGQEVFSCDYAPLISVGGDIYTCETENGDAFGLSGYGIWRVYDRQGELTYQSPLKELLIRAEENFVVAMRGNDLCVMDAEGTVLYRTLSTAMDND